jgi:hypothetical protein
MIASRSSMPLHTRKNACARARVPGERRSAGRGGGYGEAAKQRPTLFKTMIGTPNHTYVVDLIWQAYLEGRDHGFEAGTLVRGYRLTRCPTRRRSDIVPERVYLDADHGGADAAIGPAVARSREPEAPARLHASVDEQRCRDHRQPARGEPDNHLFQRAALRWLRRMNKIKAASSSPSLRSRAAGKSRMTATAISPS